MAGSALPTEEYGDGTLGGMVIDRETGAKMILSNWHVLVGLWHARPGWPIYQPGQGDGGTTADTVARLSRDAMEPTLMWPLPNSPVLAS